MTRGLADRYLFATVEFGTYGPVTVLGGLRAENQAHHWGQPGSRVTRHAKQRLRELFCPESAHWRVRAVDGGLALLERALRGLAAAS
jgi:hypothetical protein